MAVNIIEYKGYQAELIFSQEDSCFYGKVLDVEDSIIFEIDDASKTYEIFKDAIDDYIEFCKETNQEPCKPYSGKFNTRISPDLHKKAVQKARAEGETLNTFVEKAIENRVNGTKNEIHNVNIYISQNQDKKQEYNEYDFDFTKNYNYNSVKYHPNYS